MPGEQLETQALMEPFDLAGGRGRPHRGEAMGDAVLATDPFEQHLHDRFGEPTSEDLAVVGEDLVGHTMSP